MGVYISDILGTVTPVYTVSITSRVAGQLMQVSYREGQIVHKGDLLAVIDPRPYEAALEQAEGQLQRDQALTEKCAHRSYRYQAAYAQHAIPEQTLATQEATVNQDEGTVKLDQGNVDAAKVNVEYTKITSPIDGRVGLRQVDPGNIVPANGTASLVDNHPAAADYRDFSDGGRSHCRSSCANARGSQTWKSTHIHVTTALCWRREHC